MFSSAEDTETIDVVGKVRNKKVRINLEVLIFAAAVIAMKFFVSDSSVGWKWLCWLCCF